MFPEIKRKLRSNLKLYQDKYKNWKRKQLLTIQYLRSLNDDSMEELTYKIGHEFFDEGQIIFKYGDDINKLYILIDGSINVYVSLNDEDLILDTLDQPGTVFGQFTILDKSFAGYSARTTSETNMLVIDREFLWQLRRTLPDLDESLKEAMDKLAEHGMPLLDYQAARKKPEASIGSEISPS